MKEEKLLYGISRGFERESLEKYINSIPSNCLQLSEDNDVLLYCYLIHRNGDEFWLDSKKWESWKTLGFDDTKAKEYADHYEKSGWVGDHQHALYFAHANICDSTDYLLRKKYGKQRTKEIKGLFF